MRFATEPSSPPSLPPPPVWNCGGVVALDMPTEWWSAEDEGLAITFSINLGISCGCLLAFLLLSRVPSLARAIYSPLTSGDAPGRPWAPRTWWEVLRKGEQAAHLTNADAGSLDRTMLLRYLRMNLKLFGIFGLLALPVMLPLYARKWDDGTMPLVPPEQAGLPADKTWSGLDSLSITHIPPGSPRFLAPVVYMFVFTALFFYLLRAEWRAYLSLRHAWLAQPRVEALSVLVRLGARSRVSADEVGARLRRLWPAEVHAVLPVLPRDAHERAELARASPPVLQAALLDSAPRAARRAAHRTADEGGGAARDEGGGAGVGAGAEVAASYVVLFRTRRAASACARAAPLLAADAGPTRTEAAPHPADVHWRALGVPRPRAQLVRLLAWLCTLALFLAWNLPVAFVQALASLDNLERLGGWFRGLVAGMDAATRAWVSGWLSSLILTLAQMLTLYSGLLSALAGAMGPTSHTKAAVVTLQLMWLFNTCLVLLASCLVGSLFDTLEAVLRNGGCELLRLLGRALPGQSTFFLNLLLQDALLWAPLLDLLQLVPLLLLLLQRALAHCCCCLRAARCARLHARLLQLGAADARWPAAAQQLYYPYVYARAMVVTSIGTLFGCIAPVTLLVVAAWLALLLPVWTHNLSHVLRPSPQGVGFDGGGVAWPHVVRLQLLVLLVAQFALAAIQALNACYVAAALLLLVLLPSSLYLHHHLRDYYGPLAAHLPLQDCAEIDARLGAQAGAAPGVGHAGGAPPAGAGAPLPDELLQLLTEAEEAYAGGGRHGATRLQREEQHEWLRGSNSLGGARGAATGEAVAPVLAVL